MRPVVVACLLVASAAAEELPDYDTALKRQKSLSADAFYERYAPPRAYADDPKIDLAAVAFLDVIERRLHGEGADPKLTEAERATLARSGLVVLRSRAYTSFGHALYDVYSNDQPLLVTSDCVLHAFHQSFDKSLMALEEGYLSPLLRDVLQRTRTGIGKIRKRVTKDPSFQALADGVDEYVQVALCLLAGEPGETEWVRKAVQDATAGQPGELRFFGTERQVDFSQFRPRGHYTRSLGLQQYFRAMMWLGRQDLGFRITESFAELVAAFLLADGMREGGALEGWDGFERILSFLVGASDGIGPREVLKVLQACGFKRADELVRHHSPAQVLEQVSRKRTTESKILSQILMREPWAPPIRIPKVVRMIGQRFCVDAFLLHQVTFDRIPKDIPRMIPSPLDVQACFGSARALDHLRPEIKEWGYQASLAASIDWTRSLPDGTWQESVYHAWLRVLSELSRDTTGPEYPPTLRTRGWADLKLQTQLASWAQLRHDTILYAEESYSGGVTCDYCDVYVEPYPEFFDRLRDLALCMAGAADRMDAALVPDRPIGELQEHVRKLFAQFGKTMETLAGVARKELAKQPLTAEEHRFLEEAVEIDGGSGRPHYSGWYPALFYENDDCMDADPTIADVHTAPTDAEGNPLGMVLHVGVGDVFAAVVVVRGHEGKDRAYLAPVFSYYEIVEEGFHRLTDEEWDQRLHGADRPARPAWTRTLFPE